MNLKRKEKEYNKDIKKTKANLEGLSIENYHKITVLTPYI